MIAAQATPLAGTRAAAAADDFEALYRANVRDVHAYVFSLLRDRSAAEDVTALAFERAYRRRRLFNPVRGSRRAWLFGIARNAALDELRRRGRAGGALTEDIAAPQGDAAALITVREAIAALEPPERELVMLKFHVQLTNAEIARVLGTSESNAGTRLHRVLVKLRRACDEGA